MEYGNTKWLVLEKLKTFEKKKVDTWTLYKNTKKRQEINRKVFSTIQNVHPNYHFENMCLKVDHLTGDKWIIDGPKYHNENQSLSMEHSCWLFLSKNVNLT